jgi:branched-chain amino acid aminotransferase
MYINHNGQMVLATQPVFLSNNRSYRYGNGFFETLRVHNNTIPLWPYHENRIQTSLNLLGGSLPTHTHTEAFLQDILHLCKKNNFSNARVRLSFYQGNGALYDGINDPYSFTIECYELQEGQIAFNQNGLILDHYNEHKKISGNLSNLKSSNFLIYALASKYAKQHQLNDVIIYNEHNEVVDTTIANIYCVKDDIVFTPNLASGAVAGCMRQFLIENLNDLDINLEETNISAANLLNADEVFITNAVLGLRWVKQIGNINFSTTYARKIYEFMQKTLWV